MISQRLQRRLVRHHLPLLILSAVACTALFVTRPYRDVISRASFATAYPALVLLGITLMLGPWRILRHQRVPVSYDLRRDIGIWAGTLSLLHTVIGQNVHLRGRPWLYYVYPATSHHAFPLRHDLFGVENIAGLLSALAILALLATSCDLLLRRMGTPAWKRLQRWNYAAFALAALHAVCYQWNEKNAHAFHLLGFACIAAAALLQLAGFLARRSSSVTASA